MSTPRINRVIEKPLTRDEINERLFQMMQARQNQGDNPQEKALDDVQQEAPFFRPPVSALTREEINERLQKMMKERDEQDAAVERMSYRSGRGTPT